MNQTSSARASSGPRHIFGMPALMGAFSIVGLLSALLGDDMWDVLSWLALGIPLLAIAWCVTRPVSR